MAGIFKFRIHLLDIIGCLLSVRKSYMQPELVN